MFINTPMLINAKKRLEVIQMSGWLRWLSSSLGSKHERPHSSLAWKGGYLWDWMLTDWRRLTHAPTDCLVCSRRRIYTRIYVIWHMSYDATDGWVGGHTRTDTRRPAVQAEKNMFVQMLIHSFKWGCGMWVVSELVRVCCFMMIPIRIMLLVCC